MSQKNMLDILGYNYQSSKWYEKSYMLYLIKMYNEKIPKKIKKIKTKVLY